MYCLLEVLLHAPVLLQDTLGVYNLFSAVTLRFLFTKLSLEVGYRLCRQFHEFADVYRQDQFQRLCFSSSQLYSCREPWLLELELQGHFEADCLFFLPIGRTLLYLQVGKVGFKWFKYLKLSVHFLNFMRKGVEKRQPKSVISAGDDSDFHRLILMQ